MTLWQSGGLAFGYVVYSLAWLRGGRSERFGAGVMLFGNLLMSRVNSWEVGGFYPGIMGVDAANLVIFGWLCLRSERWWPLVVAAGSALIVLAYVIRLLDPALSHYALASAKVGLAYVVDLALLLGVWERWLAGEPAAGPAAWARALRSPPGRPGRRGAESRSGAGVGARHGDR